MIDQNSKIYIAGHNGMVGSACLRLLQSRNYKNLIFKTSKELDLRDQIAVNLFFEQHKPDAVIIAAARVGGIHANDIYGYDFLMDNLLIQNNLIIASENHNVEKVIFLGSSCIYPQLAKQPMSEDCLLSGKLEPTNEPYAIAKIAGIKMCESYNRQYGVDYRCVMPTNLYGQNDNFHPHNSHVIPAMMPRFHEAKITSAQRVVVWGTGKPMREFLHVDDLAAACVHVMNLPHVKFTAAVPNPMSSHINVGTGRDVTIAELANTMARVVGFEGDIEFDTSKPDGTPQKLLDVSRLSSLGWQYSVELEQGLEMTYQWFLDNLDELRS